MIVQFSSEKDKDTGQLIFLNSEANNYNIYFYQAREEK